MNVSFALAKASLSAHQPPVTMNRFYSSHLGMGMLPKFMHGPTVTMQQQELLPDTNRTAKQATESACQSSLQDSAIKAFLQLRTDSVANQK
jgi:hypothetical protein